MILGTDGPEAEYLLGVAGDELQSGGEEACAEDAGGVALEGSDAGEVCGGP